MITNTHVTLQSNNRKTGPITTTGRPRATCPTTCTFNPENPEGVGGCYTVGRIDSMYRRYARDWEYQELREFLVDSKTDRLRDRVDGAVSMVSSIVSGERLDRRRFSGGLQVDLRLHPCTRGHR